MAIRKIVLYPHKSLTTKGAVVEEVTDEIRTLVDDMLETMYDAKGIGLAAPQIDVSLQVCVLDIARKDEPSDVRVLINPVIKSTGTETMKWEEGCLSFPDLYGDVIRPSSCVVEALDRDGNLVEHHAEGLLAICMQHEIDHLNGILFINRMSPLKRRMAMKKYKKLLERARRAAEEAEEEAASEADEASLSGSINTVTSAAEVGATDASTPTSQDGSGEATSS